MVTGAGGAGSGSLQTAGHCKLASVDGADLHSTIHWE